MSLAITPQPPYFAVIFTSEQTGEDIAAYEETATRMVELASEQPGYLGIESVRNEDGTGITVSYWKDLESIRAWKQNAEHRDAQQAGQSRWYSRYKLRISKVEADYGMNAD